MCVCVYTRARVCVQERVCVLSIVCSARWEVRNWSRAAYGFNSEGMYISTACIYNNICLVVFGARNLLCAQCMPRSSNAGSIAGDDRQVESRQVPANIS